MADPLSIASGVAGLVSLGLSVCQSLLEYYGAWKDYEADIATTTVSIDNLSKTLQHFGLRISEVQNLDPDAAELLANGLISCKDGIERLEKKLDKIKARANPGRLGKLEHHARRALYPFKISTLAKLQEIIADLRQNLVLAAGALQLDSAILTAQKLDEISAGITMLRNVTIQLHLGAALKDWLRAPDPSSNYNTALEKRESTTGEWFVLNSDFESWRLTPASSLWLHGGAGCGKTVLSSTIITATQLTTQDNPNSSVIYYFFDFNDPARQSAENFVASIVYQLSVRSLEAQTPLEKLYDRHQGGLRRPPVESLLATFKEMVEASKITDLYLVIDALDECYDVEVLMDDILRRMLDWYLPHLHILATSRKNRQIQSVFEELMVHSIEIEADVVDADIKTFVTRHMQRDRWWNKWSDEIRQEVSNALTQKSKGMFRWVVCQLQELRKSVNVKMLRRLLNGLPRTLDDTYNRILKNLDLEYTEYAARLFPWLCYIHRPVTLEEANDMLATRIGDESGYDAEEHFDDPYDLQQICYSLLTIPTALIQDPGMPAYRGQKSSKVIRLAHYSVKEFLVSDRLKDEARGFKVIETEAHRMITETCIQYLLRFDEEGSWTPLRQSDFPLAQYAATYWYQHFRLVSESQDNEILHDLAIELLQPESNAFRSLTKIHDVDSAQPHFSEQDMVPLSPLYYVAATGLSSLAAKLLDGNPELASSEASEGLHGSALKAAICNRDVMMVKTLLGHGVDIATDREIKRPYKITIIGPYTIIEPADQYGHSPLAVAAEEEDDTILNVIVDHLKPSQATFDDCDAALRYLAKRQTSTLPTTYHRLIMLLFQSSSQKNPSPKKMLEPYMGSAISSDNTRMLVAMLADGADPNFRHLDYAVLYEAAVYGFIDSVKALLDAGADVNGTNPPLRVPLHLGAVDPPPHIKDDKLTALHAVSKSLLKVGTDETLPTVRTKASQIMIILIKAGGQIDAPSHNGHTPASLWLLCGHEDIVFDPSTSAEILEVTISKDKLFAGKGDLSNTHKAFEKYVKATELTRRFIRRWKLLHRKGFISPVSKTVIEKKKNKEEEETDQNIEQLPGSDIDYSTSKIPLTIVDNVPKIVVVSNDEKKSYSPFVEADAAAEEVF